MTKPKAGLLPLYLELYDRSNPDMRKRPEAFTQEIAAELEKRGISVARARICRLAGEFKAAVRALEKEGVDSIITLHLAYSPSLESGEALARTRLPILVLDTTPDDFFGPEQAPGAISYNHGIHGVQDMCNMLIRNGKSFQIEAGHWKRSDVLDRIACWAASARLVTAMRNARVGQIGPAFKGMGDFSVPAPTLRRTIGVETVACNPASLKALLPAISDPAIDKELALDRKRFKIAEGLDPAIHRRSVQAGLAVRRWMEKNRLTAFTASFLNIDSKSALPTVPFLEACKAMARGQGYAGEGDVLTASFVGALASAFPETTFTEMFCPDWKGGTIFLSHMGEINPSLVHGKATLMAKPFPYTDTKQPANLAGCLKAGKAVFANIAPGPADTFSLVLAPVAMLCPRRQPKLQNCIRGWMKSTLPVGEFLAQYSKAGGTHHAALVYGDVLDKLAGWGTLMGWKTVIIR
ncbi:MAG: hypothetical protein GX608_01405 [Lentisphaerae bacterium]|nr:hypothetical protein [Lentisphaerota bacterium]